VHKLGSGTGVDYINLASAGNSTDFGDMNISVGYIAGLSSSTRAIFGMGYAGGNTDTIEFTTIATTGSFTDFGNALTAHYGAMGLSNSSRGIFAGHSGGGTASNVIQYVTIASAGNATDFGDMTSGKYLGAACSSTTRGILSGGTASFTGTTAQNIIEFITIANTGNATDFGDLSIKHYNMGGLSSNTRGVFAGGLKPQPNQMLTANTIEFITISSAGNVTDFGDLTNPEGEARSNPVRGTSGSNGRGIFIIGQSTSESIDSITISSTGNSIDFGDSTSAPGLGAVTSGSHGGLA
jgi:hypothetical protein